MRKSDILCRRPCGDFQIQSYLSFLGVNCMDFSGLGCRADLSGVTDVSDVKKKVLGR